MSMVQNKKLPGLAMFHMLFAYICAIVTVPLSIGLGISLASAMINSGVSSLPVIFYLLFLLMLAVAVFALHNIFALHARKPKAPLDSRRFIALVAAAPFIAYLAVYASTENRPDLREVLRLFDSSPGSWASMAVFLLLGMACYFYWQYSPKLQQVFGPAAIPSPDHTPANTQLLRLFAAAALLTGLGYIATLVFSPPQDEKTMLPAHLVYALLFFARWVAFGAVVLILSAPARLNQINAWSRISAALALWFTVTAAFVFFSIVNTQVYYYHPFLYQIKFLPVTELVVLLALLWHAAASATGSTTAQARLRDLFGVNMPVLGLLAMGCIFALGTRQFAAMLPDGNAAVLFYSRMPCALICIMGPALWVVMRIRRAPSTHLLRWGLYISTAAALSFAVWIAIYWWAIYQSPGDWGGTGAPGDLKRHAYAAASFIMDNNLPELILLILCAIYFRASGNLQAKPYAVLFMQAAAWLYLCKAALPALALACAYILDWNIGGVVLATGREHVAINDLSLLYAIPSIGILIGSSTKFRGKGFGLKTLLACVLLLILCAAIIPILYYVAWFMAVYAPYAGMPGQMPYIEAAATALSLYWDGAYFNIQEPATAVSWVLGICLWVCTTSATAQRYFNVTDSDNK